MDHSRASALTTFQGRAKLLAGFALLVSCQDGSASPAARDEPAVEEPAQAAPATPKPHFDDSETLAAMIPLTTPNVVRAIGDREQTFTSLSGKTVTIIVQVPHPAHNATYRVPALAAGHHADAYFTDAIGYAQQHGYGSVVFPRGTYNFASTWQESSLTDLTIDLQGSTLNFAKAGYAVVFNGPTRVMLKNFTVDYPDLTFAATGTIIEGSDGNKAVKIDGQYPVDGRNPPAILAVEIWDSAKYVFAEGQTIDYFPSPADYQYAGNQIYLSADGFFNGYPENSPVLVRYSYPGGGGVALAAAHHVTLENVHVTSSPGFGFFFPGGDGFRLTDCSVSRSNGRPISSVADALNFSSAEGDIILEDGDFSYQGDDGFSDGGNMRQVESISGDKVTIAGDGTTANLRDVFAFFDKDLKYLGESAVSADSQSENDSTDELTLITPIPSLKKNNAAWAINLFMAGSRVYVSGNRFAYNRARGVYAINPYSLVEKNSFDGNTLASVLVATDVGVFFQGAAAVDLQIIDNSFANTAPDGAIYATAFNSNGVVNNSVLQNISIENNDFDHLLGPAIQLNSSRGIRISGNAITNSDVGSYSYAVGTASTKGSVTIADSTDVSGNSNMVSMKYGPLSIDPDTTKSIDVELKQVPNPGGTIDELFGETCETGSTCYYSAAKSASSETMACASGVLRIRQATYGSPPKGLIESCLGAVQKACDGEPSCAFSFSTSSCGGLDPAPHETKTGTTLVSCQ